MSSAFKFGNLTRIAFLVVFFLVSQIVLATEQDTLILGNGTNRTVAYKSVGSSGKKAGFALFYPESRMQAYAGCTVTSVCVDLVSADGTSPLRVFVARDLDGEPLCEKTVYPESEGWTNVKFDTPCVLDGSAVYVGYEVSGVYNLCYSSRLVDGQEWIKSRDGDWQSLEDGYSASLYAVLRGETLPGSDIVLGHVIMPAYSAVGEPLTYSGDFVNFGANTVNSISVVVHADDSETVFTVDGLDVEPRGTGSFSISDFVLDAEGEPDTWVEVRNVNGVPDAAPYDNASRHKSLLCLDDYVRRNVLLEVFSTERCPNCPGYHQAIADVLGDKAGLVEIGHHAGYYTDSYTIDESLQYEWFYKPGWLYAPAVMFDRTCMYDNYPTIFNDSVPVMDCEKEGLEVFYDESIAVPAFATVNIEPTLDISSRHLDLNVNGGMLVREKASNPCLFVFLTEDSVLTTTQSGASGDYYHRHVARRSLTPAWGEQVDLKNGYSENFSVDIPEEWNMKNVSVVAFVGNYDASDRNNCEVLNSAERSIADLMPSGIDDIACVGENRILGVYTLSGTRMNTYGGHNAETLVEALPHGVYVVDMVSGGKRKRVKVVAGEE